MKPSFDSGPASGNKGLSPETAPPVRPYHWLLAIAGTATALVLIFATLLVLVVTSYLRLSPEAAALCISLQQAGGTGWQPKLKLNVGNFTLDLARMGLAFMHLDSDARAAITALRGAEVGVYERRGGPTQFDTAAILAEADRKMTARGWQRLVGVVKPQELVAIYLPGTLQSPHDVRFCMAVINRDGLIVTSAQGNLEPLMAIASRHLQQAAAAGAPSAFSERPLRRKASRHMGRPPVGRDWLVFPNARSLP